MRANLRNEMCVNGTQRTQGERDSRAFSPRYSKNPSGTSVARIAVNEIQQRVPTPEAAEIFAEEIDHVIPVVWTDARAVRSNYNIRKIP